MKYNEYKDRYCGQIDRQGGQRVNLKVGDRKDMGGMIDRQIDNK